MTFRFPDFTNKLIFVTGKGGVGKSFTASLLAYQLSQQGHRTALVEFDPHGQLGPLFGVKSPPGSIHSPSHNLSIQNFEFKENFELFLNKKVTKSKIIALATQNKFFQSLIETTPGIKELLLLGRLVYMSQHMDEFDRIVVDCFATGHFVNLISSPQSVAKINLEGNLFDDVKTIRNALANPEHTSGIIVTNSESITAKETYELYDKITAKSLLNISLIVSNRSLSPLLPNLPKKHPLIEQENQIQSFADEAHCAFLKIPEYGFVKEPLQCQKYLEGHLDQKL